MHQCKEAAYTRVEFYITPTAGHSDVVVCVLPEERGVEVTTEEIMINGTCTAVPDGNKQYVLAFDLDPSTYTAHIYAHSDYSFVSIPALRSMEKDGHYAFDFTMGSCDHRAEFTSSDSYSITLRDSYVWSEMAAPLLTVYYSDNLQLKLKDIARFSKVTFAGERGMAQQDLTVAGLTPFTTYQFYVFATSTVDAYASALISNHVFGTTYDTCRDELWEETGVGTESRLTCSIGYHAYYCAKDVDYHAVFTTRRDACFCPEETLYDITFPETPYGEYVETPAGRRYCGWRGVWDPVPLRGCMADGEWEAAGDGEVKTKRCQNGGQLTRKCSYGVWGPVVDQNCKCPSVMEREVQWAAANRNEVVTHACMAGSMTRACNEWGWWQVEEDHECSCATETIWELTPHNTTQTQPCGDRPMDSSFVTRRCGYDGFWRDEDFEYCRCSPLTEDGITWQSVRSLNAAVVQCDIGSKARLCVPYGAWDSTIANYECQCAGDQGWENTPADTTAFLPCPDNALKMQMRQCSSIGTWGEIDSMACYGSCPAYGRFPVTMSGTEGVVTCDEGGGKIVMNCLRKVDANGEFYGEWDLASWHVVGECNCPSDGVFPSAAVNTDGEVQCDISKRTRKCGKFTARWEAVDNHECQCSMPDSSLAPTPLFDTAELACEVGSRTARCGEQGHFENLEDAACFCAAKDGFAETHAREEAKHDCAETGKETRVCAESGFWESVDYADCKCNGIPQVTELLPINTSFLQQCPVGGYDVECSATGNTNVRERSCACPAIEGFPETPAGTMVEEQCGQFAKTAFCTLNGEWTQVHNPCYCPATDMYPRTPFNETTEALLPQCYKGYCNPATGQIETQYDECGCLATDEWPAMRHGESETRPCTGGGSRTATCTLGVTHVEYNDCDCAKDGEVIAVGDYLNNPCMIGFILKQCRGNNIWYDVTDSYCGCSSDEEGLKAFQIVPAGETGHAQCGSGEMSIFCDETGHYFMDTWRNNCKCPADGLWEETDRDATASLACSGGTGTATRLCGRYGVWEEAESPCQCPEDGEWPASAPGEYTQTCESGSVIRRVCGVTGEWEAATGSCLDRSCPAEGPFGITPHGAVATHVCGNGAVVTRKCTSGLWGVADWSTCGCADDDGFKSGEFIDEAVYSTWSSVDCEEGQKVRECRYGLWQEVDYRDCFCKSTALLPKTQANHVASKNCTAGSVSKLCDRTGHWTDIEDTCSCAAISDPVTGIEMPATMHGEVATMACLKGEIRMRCDDNAEWGRTDNSQCWCVEEGWNQVRPGEDGEYFCQEGSYRKRCGANGQWGNVFSSTCSCSANGVYPHTPVGTEMSHQCGVGTMSARCDLSGWTELSDEGCSCVETEEYPTTAHNTTAEAPCGVGFEGVKHRRCLYSGFWDDEEDKSACVPWCIAVDEWPSTKPGSSVTLPCPEGYTGGEIRRACNANGLWEKGVSTCTPMRCAAEGDYPVTPINGNVVRACPPGETGAITRRCVFREGAAVWDDVHNTCETAFCAVGDKQYAHDAEITVDCGEGHTGARTQRCNTGVWEVLEDTCERVRCAADEERGLPAGVYGDVFLRNCGMDYTGTITMLCNAKEAWEHVSGSCAAIQPVLRCEPRDNSEDVELTAVEKDHFTVLCTSNVRIERVLNDEEQNSNVFVVFDLEDAQLFYPTRTEMLSDYTVGFRFDGSFPPSCSGALYVLANTFTATNQLAFPTATLVQYFSTRSGNPLPPAPVSEKAIHIESVDYAARTVSLRISLPFTTSLYDEGEIAFLHSNLRAVRFTQDEVLVEGAVLGNVIAMVWRVRRGDFWSDFSAITVYQPVTLLAPTRPVADSYSVGTAQWSWQPTELYDQVVASYAYRLFRDGELAREASVAETYLELAELEPGTYTLQVAACNEVCSPFSEASAAITLLAKLATPGAPRDLKITFLSSTHLKLTWSAPASTGGKGPVTYLVHRSATADFATVTEEISTAELAVDFLQVREAFFVRVACFNGYLSSFVTLGVQPAPLAAAWTVSEDALFDNAFVLTGSFNYLAKGACTAVSTARADFSKRIEFSATLAAKLLFDGLLPDSAYTVTCEAREIAEADAVVTTTLEARTRATEDFSPVLVVDGEPTSAVTAVVAAFTNMVGDLICYVAPYEGASSRPTDLRGFESNWSQSARVTDVSEAQAFVFSYDVNGELLHTDSTYHAWCVMHRQVAAVMGDTVLETTVVFPQYGAAASEASEASEASQTERVVQQAEVFRAVAVTPAEFATDVNPSTELVVEFSAAATLGAGAVRLLEERNVETEVQPAWVQCVETKCAIRVPGGLKPLTKYTLSVEKTAFESEGVPMEEDVEDHVFVTGQYRCDTKFVSKGLSDSRVCECFSVGDQCECECGETSVARSL